MFRIVLSLQDREENAKIRSWIRAFFRYGSVKIDEYKAPDAPFSADLLICDKVRTGQLFQQEDPDLQILYVFENTAPAAEMYRTVNLGFMLAGEGKEIFYAFLVAALRSFQLKDPRFLQVKWNGRVHFVPVGKIVSLEKDLRRIIVHLTDGTELTAYMTMDEAMQQLPDDFIKTHASCVVNRWYIDEISPDMLTTTTGRTLPVSRAGKRNLQQVEKQW